MDTFRVIALRHVLKMSDRQIVRILSKIEENGGHLLNSIDVAYFTSFGVPVTHNNNFRSIDWWLNNKGYEIYLRLKGNQFILFGRSLDKMVKRINKRHDKH